mgnify:CR=1 FL=1
MPLTTSEIKEKMKELADLFSKSQKTFQRIMFIYDYVILLNTEPLAQKSLQKLLQKQNPKTHDICADQDDPLKSYSMPVFSTNFKTCYTNFEAVCDVMDALKDDDPKIKKIAEELCHFFIQDFNTKEMFQIFVNSVLKCNFS